MSELMAHFTIWDRFVNTQGILGKIISCDLFLEFWNKTAKTIIRAYGLRNLTEEKLMDIGASISTVNTMVTNMVRQCSVTESHGLNSRHKRNVKKEKELMDYFELREVLTDKSRKCPRNISKAFQPIPSLH